MAGPYKVALVFEMDREFTNLANARAAAEAFARKQSAKLVIFQSGDTVSHPVETIDAA